MRDFKQSLVLAALLATTSIAPQAAEVCKVSMMGRICFEEGSPEATAAHMKGDAVAEAQANKKKSAAAAVDNSPKKVAEK